ncbi:MAG TPA: ABC transporter substrate-binding protein [Candidatus Binatia bacterium]|nr:ABC transporter substrate-binding protein [Candidatus Binatia bacterium]
MRYEQLIYRARRLSFVVINLWLLSVSINTAAGADKVRVAFSAVAPTQGVLWVAEVGGLFKKNDLNAEIIYTRAAIETLVAGEVDFAQMTGALMSSARLQGADPVMIAGVQDTLEDRLIVRSNIKSVEELKGKRIGVFRFGAASHLRFLYVLARYGFSDRDVTLLQVGDTPERLIALSAGSIDATLLSPPDHFEAQRMGMKILLNLRDFKVPFQGTGLVTTQRLLAKRRDVARRFLKSYVEAIHVVKTNPELSKKAFAKYRQTKDEKRLEDAYQALREIVKPKPYPSLEGFKTIIEDASERMPAAKKANPRDFIDVSLLEELERSGYMDALYR